MITLKANDDLYIFDYNNLDSYLYYVDNYYKDFSTEDLSNGLNSKGIDYLNDLNTGYDSYYVMSYKYEHKTGDYRFIVLYGSDQEMFVFLPNSLDEGNYDMEQYDMNQYFQTFHNFESVSLN